VRPDCWVSLNPTHKVDVDMKFFVDYNSKSHYMICALLTEGVF